MKSPIRFVTALSLACALFSFGCEGSVELQQESVDSEPVGSTSDSDGATVPGDSLVPTPHAEACEGEERSLSDLPARLLTATEYNRAVAELFPDIAVPVVDMPLDSRVGPFVLNARERISSSHIRDFRIAAETISETVVDEFDSFVSCELDETLEETLQCFEPYIDTLLTRAFRRPPTSDDLDRFRTLFEHGWSEAGTLEGFRWTVEALLQSPSFLYVYELGGTETIDDYEIAQNMASTLWRSVPDDALLARAAAGELVDKAVRAQEAGRMLDDPRGLETLRSVVIQWLGLERLTSEPFAQDEEGRMLAAAMLGETRAFVDDVMEGSASYIDLLDSNYTLVNERMAAHYGLDLNDLQPVQDDMWRAELENRSGLLGHASFLALEHGVVHRGLSIRSSVMCQLVPGPVGVDTESIPTEPGESERSKSSKRLQESACAGCHLMMDPLGLAFDSFDGLGRHRESDEHGNAILSRGKITSSIDANGEVSDAVELTHRLAYSTDVRNCVSAQLFTWTFARVPKNKDACIVQDIANLLDQNDGDLRRTLIELIEHDAFIQRKGALQ